MSPGEEVVRDGGVEKQGRKDPALPSGFQIPRGTSLPWENRD